MRTGVRLVRMGEKIFFADVVELPKVKGYSIIWVVVDRFSKMAHFIPLKTTQAKELADAFIQYIWKYHWLPISIVSD